MAFENVSAFLHMGGHAPYVWTAYGVTLLVLAYNLLAPIRQQREFVRQARQRQLRADHHPEAAT